MMSRKSADGLEFRSLKVKPLQNAKWRQCGSRRKTTMVHRDDRDVRVHLKYAKVRGCDSEAWVVKATASIAQAQEE